MKQLFYIVILLLPLSGIAQISFEHNYKRTYTLQVIHLEGETDKYFIIDTMDKAGYLYNSDHSFWKQLSYTIPSGWFYSSISCISTHLFNSDNNVEFAYTIYTRTPSISYSTKIINEGGALIQSLDGITSCYPIKIDGTWKLCGYRQEGYSYDIYSVPGTYLSIKAPGGPDLGAETSIYPNPVDVSATLKYALPTGTRNGTLTVYDAQGVAVRTYQVTDQFSDILIQRESLPAGLYTYSLAANNQVLSTDKFMIK